MLKQAWQRQNKTNRPAGHSTSTWAGLRGNFEGQVAALEALSGHFERLGNAETGPNGPAGHSSSTQAGPSGHFEAQVAPVR